MAQPRTQALSSGKERPGRSWSRDAYKIDCLRGYGCGSLSFIYLEKARQSFFSQTVEAKNMADF